MNFQLSRVLYGRNETERRLSPVASSIMKLPRTNIGLSVAFAALTFASFRVTISAADLEPFVTYSRSDALYYVGFAAELMAFWLQLAIGLIAGVVLKRLAAWWLIGALWSFAGLFCVGTAVDTWTSDMEHHAFRVRPSNPSTTQQ